MFSSALYKRAPVSLQSALISLRALTRKLLREGAQFEQLLREIEKTQQLSAADLATWQEVMLKRLLVHAALQVPFYRDLALGMTVADASAFDALKAFPVLDKAVVRNSASRFMAANARPPLFKGSTSGTTGSPLVLLQDLHAINRENTFVWRQLKWAGLNVGDRRAWMRGDLVVPVDVDVPPFWRLNYAESMLMFSSYHLSMRSAPGYVDALARYDPVVIQAYPSSIGFLANWLESTGQHYPGKSLKGIVTSSEMLDESKKSIIEARFGCQVFDWYGQFERVAAIGTCEKGRHHVIGDYSIVELFPAENGLFEIVGTGLNNFAMPLIRYRTGDFVSIDDTMSTCTCGRSFPVVASIHGRSEDVVKVPDGRHIGRLDHIFKGVDGILESQIRQDHLDRIDILVVPNSDYHPGVEARLLANARERLGGSVQLKLIVLDSIPRTSNGKFRGVVCNV
jgi:phenylacetate-CoA ligase